jgi:glycosyltransferase involved in cell wall biosynthesis
LLHELDRSLFAPSLALFRLEGAFLEDVPADVPVLNLEAASLWTAWRPLAALLRANPPDILLSTCSGTNVVACLARLLTGNRLRLVLSERNVMVRDQPPVKKWLLLAAKRLLYPSADGITAVSSGVKSDLMARLGIAENRIRVVYNPVVGPELVRLAAEEVPDRRLIEPPPTILGAGRLVPAKGFDTLIRAFALVRRHREAKLVILGEGPLRLELLKLAEELGVAGQVALPGFDKNPFRYMARCSVFVLSSRFEGLPGVLIQAMACGVPVISTNCPAGPGEIIDPDRDGVLVPVDSPRQLAEQIVALLDDPARCSTMGRRAREKASTFSVDSVMDRYVRGILGAPESSQQSPAEEGNGSHA